VSRTRHSLPIISYTLYLKLFGYSKQFGKVDAVRTAQSPKRSIRIYVIKFSEYRFDFYYDCSEVNVAAGST
jgi:hypothetical protein